MGQIFKIFIADDHPVFRCGLKEIIHQTQQFEIVGESANGEQALEKILTLKPDLVLLDVDMPGMTGLDIAENLNKEITEINVIILTSYKEESFFNRAMDLGVKGYILKENAINDLTDGLLSVSRGEIYLSPSISSFLLKRAQRNERAASKNTGFDSLTPSELRVLRLVADNLTSKEIGEKLFISPRTVDTHRNNICTKLDLRGSRGLLMFALEHRDDLKCFKVIPGD